MREATFTTSPKRQYRARVLPCARDASLSAEQRTVRGGARTVREGGTNSRSVRLAPTAARSGLPEARSRG
eukprot:2179631-Pyramimonas_sp.AAC.1